MFLLGIIFGVIGYFFVQNYIKKQDEIKLEKLDLISSLDDFVSRIYFHNGDRLDMSEADMIYYNYINTKISEVFMFSAREFYALNKNNQGILNEMINDLSETKKLNGITFSNKTTTPEMELHKALHKWSFNDENNNFLKIKLSLEKKLKRSNISIDEMKNLQYIYNLEGEYESAEKLKKNICKSTKNKCKQVEVSISGIVKDAHNVPLKGATISVLNLSNKKPAITNEEGYFQLNIKTDYLSKIRIRAVKIGFSDGFESFYIYKPENKKYEKSVMDVEANFTLNQAHAIIILDLDNNKIELKERGIVKSVNFKDNEFHIKTKENTYNIPKNSFINSTKHPFLKGKVEVDLYEFNRDSTYAMENLVLADISSDEGKRMFLGGFLTTFGMPYMQFFSESGEELFVSKSKPIHMIYQLVEMKQLQDKYNNERPITEEDLNELVELSKKSKEYPLSKEYLNTLPYDFPPWWMLNRKKGMWENVPFKMLNTTGLLETIYYSYD